MNTNTCQPMVRQTKVGRHSTQYLRLSVSLYRDDYIIDVRTIMILIKIYCPLKPNSAIVKSPISLVCPHCLCYYLDSIRQKRLQIPICKYRSNKVWFFPISLLVRMTKVVAKG